MNCALRLGLVTALLALGVTACQRSEAGKAVPGAAASASAGQLDAMEFSSARRVGLESATAAMKRHDLERLKQLSSWVRHRAQVALFEPDDLKALDISIACLEQSSPASEALAQLDQLQSGKLRVAARAACSGTAEH